jgi:tetratricopeptide (TPR) repeat protein
MKPSNELFDLIKSLSKSEKRFFKLQSALQSGDKNYVRLFDCIDKMDGYDEEVIKKAFKGEKFVKHLPSEKNHLYKLILKALRSYYGDTSVSSILKQEIKNIEILYNKALFEECNKFLMRAKKLAIKYEKFYYLFELINWEKMLLEEAFEDGQFTKDLDTLIREEQDVIEKLRNLAAYHVLYSKINYVFRSGGYTRTEENKAIVEEIVNHPLIKGKNTALSRRAATICYYTQGFCNMAIGDYETAITKFARVREILDEHEHLKEDLSKRYIRALTEMSNCLIDMGRYSEAEQLIHAMEAQKEKDGFEFPDVQMSIFKSVTFAKLQMYRVKGEFEKGIAYVEELSEKLKTMQEKVHKEQELNFFYQFAYMYFSAQQYNKALYWLNKVLNDNENTLRQDIYSYARLFNLAIHFELGNYDLLEYTIKSTLRYLQKRERDFPMEKLIIESFKKLIRQQPAHERKKNFELFHTDLERLSKDQDGEVVLKYFDFLKWSANKAQQLVPA